METEHVVILGGGFGGIAVAQALRRVPVQITLVDRRNYHLFQPLLYQVATGGLSPANIAAPLRSIFKRQKNVQVLLGEVQDIDLAARHVYFNDGDLTYDWLVVATGSSHHYFGNDQWETHAPGLKTIEDATEIRSRVLMAFEQAEKETDPLRVRQLLRFVVVGGGPTGVELAGALAEIARDTLKHEFRSINPADAEIILLEGGDRVLPSYPGQLPYKAESQLKDLRVTVRTSAMVMDVQDDRVIARIDGKTEKIDTSTVLWGAGVKASPLGELLAQKAGLQSDSMGRIPIGPDLTVPGYPEVFVVGDLARFEHGSEGPLPGVAPVAIQQGKHCAKTIRNRIQGKETPSFRYRDWGTMATIGRHRAVAVVGSWRFSGYLAWLMWLTIHLMYIVEFQNRLLVFIQWAWHYLTWNRSARLITNSRRATAPLSLTRTDRSTREPEQPREPNSQTTEIGLEA
ncbi:MAG: NAD(P)/FAD-dependent oxidoreductase [Thermoguttaceae bacterium]